MENEGDSVDVGKGYESSTIIIVIGSLGAPTALQTTQSKLMKKLTKRTTTKSNQ